MEFKLDFEKFGNNPKFRDEPAITIKSGRISFNVKLVKMNDLQKNKYVYINGPYKKDANHITIAFILSEKSEIIPGKKPFTLNRHSNVERFQVTPKSWFDDNNLSPDSIEGTYTPLKKTDSRIGTYFIIEVELKK